MDTWFALPVLRWLLQVCENRISALKELWSSRWSTGRSATDLSKYTRPPTHTHTYTHPHPPRPPHTHTHTRPHHPPTHPHTHTHPQRERERGAKRSTVLCDVGGVSSKDVEHSSAKLHRLRGPPQARSFRLPRQPPSAATTGYRNLRPQTALTMLADHNADQEDVCANPLPRRCNCNFIGYRINRASLSRQANRDLRSAGTEFESSFPLICFYGSLASECRGLLASHGKRPKPGRHSEQLL